MKKASGTERSWIKGRMVMHKNVNKIMCGMLAAAAALGMMTGCSKTDGTTSAAAGTGAGHGSNSGF